MHYSMTIKSNSAKATRLTLDATKNNNEITVISKIRCNSHANYSKQHNLDYNARLVRVDHAVNSTAIIASYR